MSPNLFIIGAMKAGTSSLHEYLHQHPEIFMSRMKEPQYFAPHVTRQGLMWGQGQPHPEPGIDWYLRLFAEAGNAKYVGESSVSYTAIPWVSGCAERIHAFNPEARLIYLVRDPVERAISHYFHFVADGREDRPMSMAFQQTEEYTSRSDYLRQITPYWNCFGKNAVYVLTLEELTEKPGETLKSLFRWLDVAPDVEIDTSTKHNVGQAHLWQTRRHLVFADTLRKNWRMRQITPWFPAKIRQLGRSAVYRKIDRERRTTPEAIAFLRDALSAPIVRFEETLERHFPEWQTLRNNCDEQIVTSSPSVRRNVGTEE